MNYNEMIDTIEETLDKHSSEINEVFENQSFHFNFVVRDCPKIRIDRIKECDELLDCFKAESCFNNFSIKNTVKAGKQFFYNEVVKKNCRSIRKTFFIKKNNQNNIEHIRKSIFSLFTDKNSEMFSVTQQELNQYLGSVEKNKNDILSAVRKLFNTNNETK